MDKRFEREMRNCPRLKETINKTRAEGGEKSEYPIEYTRQIQSDQPSICLSVTSGLNSGLGDLEANYVFMEL